MYNWVLDLMLEEFDHNYAYPDDDPNWKNDRSVDPEPWDAEQAYQLYLGDEAHERYLLCYEDHIIEIDLDWTPTDAEKAVIAEKLLP